MKKHILLLIICLQTIGGHGQNYNNDSLQNIIDNFTTDTLSFLFAKVDIANYFIYRDLDSAEIHINDVFNFIEENDNIKFPENYHRHYLVKAWLYQGNGELLRAKENMMKAYNIGILSENKETIRELQINLGSVLVQLRDSTALSFIESFLGDINIDDKNEQYAWMMGHLFKAMIYANNGDYLTAIQILLETIKSKELSNYEYDKEGLFNALGVYLDRISDHKTAIKYLKEALMFDGLFDYERKYILSNIVECFIDIREIDSCEYYLKELLNIGDFSDAECSHYNRINAKLAYINKNYKSALIYVGKANKCALKTKDVEIIFLNKILEGRIKHRLGSYRESSLLLEEVGQLGEKKPTLLKSYSSQYSIKSISLSNKIAENAPPLLEEFYEYIELNNDYRKFESEKVLKELTIAYESDKKDREIILLNQQNQIEKGKSSRRFMLIIFITILAFATILVFGLEHKNRLTIQKWRDAENHATENSYSRILDVIEEQYDLADIEQTKRSLEHTKGLVFTASLIHKTIRGIEKNDFVNSNLFREKFLDLCNNLKKFASYKQRIIVNVYCDNTIKIHPREVQSLFLLMDELFTNSCKYAFTNIPEPKVNISLTSTEKRQLNLSYRDNGIGISEKIDFEQDTVILGVIRSLTKKLGGVVMISQVEGLSYQFTFFAKSHAS